MNSADLHARFVRSWPLLAVLLIAAIWLYRPPYSASDLEIKPDTVEYALAALQLVETGRYEIILEGRGLPPRYPPWFSALVIAPAYVLFGHEPGNAILPVTLLAVIGVGFAYAIGKRISSTLGGIFSALALLFFPSYGRWAMLVMTDVPCITLMLGTCLLYLRLRTESGSMLTYFGAGTLVAITILFRPVYAGMLLPLFLTVVRPRSGAWLRAIALLAPTAAAAMATFDYNATTFGSPFRDGYKFWVPAPMDYPAMIFSLSHIRDNLTVIVSLGFPILLFICIVAVFLARTFRPAAFAASRESFRGALLFFALTTGPILLFHLVYFYPDDRFYLPVFAGLAVLCASIVALCVGPDREVIFKFLLPAALLIIIGARVATPAPVPQRRLAAERVRKYTPNNAVVISAVDPVYLARLAGQGSGRRIIPISRNVEFAWALLVRKRVDDPRMSSFKWPDLLPALALLRPHGELAVQFVASEQMDKLATAVARGTPVFLESAFVVPRDVHVIDELKARFELVERGPYLYQLQSR
jgi:4-amino-4-deoxy-L-arabinose transferase-like glycosyltransferase